MKEEDTKYIRTTIALTSGIAIIVFVLCIAVAVFGGVKFVPANTLETRAPIFEKNGAVTSILIQDINTRESNRRAVGLAIAQWEKENPDLEIVDIDYIAANSSSWNQIYTLEVKIYPRPRAK